MNRVNIGCGATPTNGWLNFDNSMSLRLSSHSAVSHILHKTRIINASQWQRIQFCRKYEITWADAAKKIPLPDDSAEVVYSSHMLEHLDRIEARRFLSEAYRILKSGGIIRLAVPDIMRLAKKYMDDGNADAFVEATYMCVPRPRSIPQRMATLLVGTRHHQWMYDSTSLCRLLAESRFKGARSIEAGSTQIADHEPLDLYERQDESIYVEAIKP